MSATCHDHCHTHSAEVTGAFRRVLWVALALNLGMFCLELTAALLGRSVALQADALDFLGDSANYAISLLVVGMHLRWRARAALLKGASMGLFGLWVLGTTAWRIHQGTVPDAQTISVVGVMAFVVNVVSAVLLYRFRSGDANMRSVWLCSRNDALANVAVIAAGAGVWATGTFWPDALVGLGIALLALTSAVEVLRRAGGELRHVRGADTTVSSSPAE